MQTIIRQVLSKLSLVASDKRGQDLIEYALLTAFIAVAVAAFFPTSIAPNIIVVFSKITAALNKV